MANKDRNEQQGNAGTPSIAQSVATDAKTKKDNDPQRAANAGSSDGVGAEAEVQFFDGSITKIDRDGNEVISDHLLPGEKLRREDDDRYDYGDPRMNDREERERKDAERREADKDKRDAETEKK